MKRRDPYFTKTELILWGASSLPILISSLVFDPSGVLHLTAALVGVASLIFSAKGNPTGQALMILFSLLYGAVSYSFSYYGEMITYLGMTMPMAITALISWLRNPYGGSRATVRVGSLRKKEPVLMWSAAVAVTVIFFFILRAFNTKNLLWGTLSVTTSFVAAYLTFRRSPYFPLAYAANDVILVLLWSITSASDLRFVPVTVCFIAFLVSDLYGFISWRRMKRDQQK